LGRILALMSQDSNKTTHDFGVKNLRAVFVSLPKIR
jgi:hypothetical protein